MRLRKAVQCANRTERRLHDAFLIASAAIANRRTTNLTERQRPTADFPKMGIAKCRPISQEPKDGTVAQKDLLATCNSPLGPGISNRELLGLEILQLAENKHHRTVLIANFEPNELPVIQAGHHQ